MRAAPVLGLVLVLVLGGCSLNRVGLGGGGDIDASRPDDASLDAGTDAELPDAEPIDARPDAEGDAGCVEGTSACAGDMVVRCVAGAPVTEACAFGCAGSPAACRQMVPSNLGGTMVAAGTANLVVPAGQSWVVNTTTGSIDARASATPATVLMTIRGAGEGDVDGIPLVFLTSPEGAEYAAFAIHSLTVQEGGGMVFVGDRAAIVIAQADVIVQGALSALSFLGAEAAGGGAPGDGAGAGAAGEDVGAGDGGGGGASHGAPGSTGGGGGAAGGLAGPTYGTTTLSPLLGGSGGGSGAGGNGGRGGFGGGALQVSSLTRIEIAARALVNASGTGGVGGLGAGADGGGGGGGGSGGAVLLEAPVVLVAGIVGALGGGGGQGAPCDSGCGTGVRGVAGGTGTPARVPAVGSATSGTGGGGAAGCDADGTTTAGLPATNGGGGGGGAGRIRIQSEDGVAAPFTGRLFPTLASGLASVGTATFAP